LPKSFSEVNVNPTPFCNERLDSLLFRGDNLPSYGVERSTVFLLYHEKVKPSHSLLGVPRPFLQGEKIGYPPVGPPSVRGRFSFLRKGVSFLRNFTPTPFPAETMKFLSPFKGEIPSPPLSKGSQFPQKSFRLPRRKRKLFFLCGQDDCPPLYKE